MPQALDLSHFSVSADGRQVLAVKTKSQSRLWSFPANLDQLTDLSAGQPLTSGGFNDRTPCWTGDGEALLFASDRRGTFDIWKVIPGAANPTRLIPGPGRRPNASPDGRWVVLEMNDDQGRYLHVARPDGSELHLLEPQLREKFEFAFHGEWSPDGSRLAAAFTDTKKGTTVGIAVMDPDTGTAREIRLLDLPGGLPERPSWSPNGRSFAYEAVSDGSWDLWIAAADGSQPRRLTSDPGNEREPTWSPDGKFLYFVKYDNGIWRIPIDSEDNPAGVAQLWAKFPKTMIEDRVAFNNDQVVIAVIEEASDLWLVEFPER